MVSEPIRDGISIVVPTYNESEGLPKFVEAVFAVLEQHGIKAEMVIVDDNSPDGTGRVADELAQRFSLRVLHRPGKLGLASAVVDGFNLASGGILGIMDADLSHAPEALPRMLEALRSGEADLAVGSRYVPGGGTEGWPFRRRFTSVAACWLARPLTGVRDATSGFLLMRREVVQGVRLNPIGFKIGLEIIAKGRYERCVEVPYIFRDRFAGKSKFGRREILAYLRQLVLLALDRQAGRGRRAPERIPLEPAKPLMNEVTGRYEPLKPSTSGARADDAARSRNRPAA